MEKYLEKNMMKKKIKLVYFFPFYMMEPLVVLPAKVFTESVSNHTKAHRLQNKRRLANQVLSIMGVRYYNGSPYVTTYDMIQKNAALFELMDAVRECYTAPERQRLYRKSVHKGMSLAKLVLRSAGHPMDRSDGYHIDAHTLCCRFRLDPDLVPPDAPILTKVSKVKVSSVCLG